MRKKSSGIARLCRVAIFVALMCISAWIQLPLGQIPFTMQLFGIYLALLTLGGVEGVAAVFGYLAVGAAGLPVFSSFTGGIGRFVDATGGFLQGFIILSVLFAVLEAILGKSRGARAICLTASLLVFYLWGAAYYSIVYLGGFAEIWAALTITVLPYIIPDLCKLVLASFVAVRLRRAAQMYLDK